MTNGVPLGWATAAEIHPHLKDADWYPVPEMTDSIATLLRNDCAVMPTEHGARRIQDAYDAQERRLYPEDVVPPGPYMTTFADEARDIVGLLIPGPVSGTVALHRSELLWTIEPERSARLVAADKATRA